MKKLLAGVVAIATIAWSLGLGTMIPAASAAYAPAAGDIIKINSANRPAVYVVGSDLKPYVFSTRSTYGSWYSDFSLLKNITQAEFDAMNLGGNVTVRPGSLIKFDNSDNVYATLPGNKLCKLPADADAKILYGNNYAARVLMIQVALVGNYTFDAACTLTKDSKLPDGTLFNYAGVPGTIYYIENGKKRSVSDESLDASIIGNPIIVDNVPVTMAFVDGIAITGKDTVLSQITLTDKGATAPITKLSKIDIFRQAFAVKYNKSIGEVSVTIQQETDSHVQGGVTIGEPGPGAGGYFFAAKVNETWKIVFDGNGAISCKLLRQYSFPASMMTDCYE